MKSFASPLSIGFLCLSVVFFPGCGTPDPTLEDAIAEKQAAVEAIYQKNLETASAHLETAEQMLESLEMPSEQAQLMLETAEVYRFNQQFPEAKDKLMQAIEQFQLLKNTEGVGDAYNILGIIAKEQGATDLAHSHYDHAIELYQEASSSSVFIAQNNKADLLIQQKQYDEALDIIDTALQESRAQELPLQTALLMLTRGEIFEKQGDMEMALLHYQDSWELIAESDNQRIKSLVFPFLRRAHERYNFVSTTSGTCDETVSVLQEGQCFCKAGFGRDWYGTECVALPEHAYFVHSKTDSWMCLPGFHEAEGSCVPDIASPPPTAEEVE
ncbi:MAG: tetratricopeptide repeat protein [Candidatus Gracilibacteria bacterium]|nr:tetratricopeptide repeat protein [Candidatus Gracilibacteria bacterium]